MRSNKIRCLPALELRASSLARRVLGMPLAKSLRTSLTSPLVAVIQFGSAMGASLLTVRDSTCWVPSLVMNFVARQLQRKRSNQDRLLDRIPTLG